MADIQRHATATWQGDTDSGSGTYSGESGEFSDAMYSFPSRFQNESGSNPEELIGAAHASCFNMVIAKELSAQGNPPDHLETEATVTLREDGGDFEVSAIHLQATATIPDVDASTFQQIAEQAKNNCPISRLLMPGLDEMTVEANLR